MTSKILVTSYLARKLCSGSKALAYGPGSYNARRRDYVHICSINEVNFN